jgi:hypothetical protein
MSDTKEATIYENLGWALSQQARGPIICILLKSALKPHIPHHHVTINGVF